MTAECAITHQTSAKYIEYDGHDYERKERMKVCVQAQNPNNSMVLQMVLYVVSFTISAISLCVVENVEL